MSISPLEVQDSETFLDLKEKEPVMDTSTTETSGTKFQTVSVLSTSAGAQVPPGKVVKTEAMEAEVLALTLQDFGMVCSGLLKMAKTAYRVHMAPVAVVVALEEGYSVSMPNALWDKSAALAEVVAQEAVVATVA